MEALAVLYLRFRRQRIDPVNAMYFWLTGVLSSFLGQRTPLMLSSSTQLGGESNLAHGTDGADTAWQSVVVQCLWGLTPTSATHRTLWSKQIAEENGMSGCPVSSDTCFGRW